MRKFMLSAAAATLAVPVAASATTTTINGTDPAYSTPVDENDDDGDNGLWGLLGLLGLAGLLGRKKSEPDIHVDARRDTTKR